MNRYLEAGWRPVCMHDPAGRRGLWVRVLPTTIELCSGREGDDAYMSLPYSKDLEDVLIGPATHFDEMCMRLIELFQLQGNDYLTAKRDS